MLEDHQAIINGPEGYQIPLFTWNPQKTSTKLSLSQQNLKCSSKDGIGFKTTLGSQIFTSGGKYYFEIFIHKGHLLKVGVSRPDVNLQSAFCDTANGWGIYNAELRHNSNSTGAKYGTYLEQRDIIGVALDMLQGTLTYFRNGNSWGIAYKDPQLTKGELVAAVSLIYANDAFELRSIVKQD